jgi:Prokaryotic N-terminal methylation motif
MRSVSTGIRAALRLLPRVARKRGGFTLLEALVALALVLSFASMLGPYMFHARRIVSGVDDRIAAQILLRSLLDAPFERSTAPNPMREGEAAGLRWRVTAEPMVLNPVVPARQRNRGISSQQIKNDPAPEPPTWTAFRVTAGVSWGAGMSISADTVRLGKAE